MNAAFRSRALPFAVVAVAALAALGVAASQVAYRPPPPPLPNEDRKAASDAVYLFMTLSAHLLGTRGDTRFAERLPAEPEVVNEVLQEIDWGRFRGVHEEPRLVRAQVRDVVAEGDRVEVLTKEFWVTRDLAAPDAPPRSDVVLARYTMRRDGSGWRVAGWDVDQRGAAAP